MTKHGTFDIFHIIVVDPPIRATEGYISGGVGQHVTLMCDVCASPKPSSYQWTFNSTDLREGIEGQDTPSITIYNVIEEDFGNYTCEVTNSIGINVFDVRFREIYSKFIYLHSACSFHSE